ncbi:MAG: right-handed parallel beta-helix repeat-containing protein, partial [Phenylobacterium sp.]
SLDVRIRDNRLEDSATHGLALRGNFIQQVDIHRNLIRGAQGNGISFDGGDVGPIVANLTISHNDIMGCVGRNAVPTALPFGGIVLGRMIELEIRDNRITDNGGDGRAAVCGVYVHRSFGAEVSRNLISNNGRPADGGAPLPGRQAGVYLAGAQIGIGSTPDPGVPGGLVLTVGNVPAARIVGNDIDSPRGHALAIIGAGPMAVEGNRLQCHDILREPGAAGGGTPLQNMLNWVGTVAIVNFGLPSWFYAFLLGAGFSGAPGWGAISITGFSLPNSQIGGHIQFRGNQVRLDLSQTHAELALANMLIISLDDVQVADNQSEGVLRANPAGLGGLGPGPGGGFDFLMADLAAFAITLRQADNGFMTTPYLTAFSIMSGAVVNHCLGNQTTSCINAVGGAPKSKRMNNAILFPHPLFCKDAGLGFD